MLPRHDERQAGGGDGLPPGLSRLRLRVEHLPSLKRQGVLTEEAGPDGTACHKLRFRHAGLQIVRYVRRDPALLEQVREELERLQAASRLNRRLRRLRHEAGRRLRVWKGRLRPALDEHGFAFHGFAIRRRRGGSRDLAGGSAGQESGRDD